MNDGRLPAIQDQILKRKTTRRGRDKERGQERRREVKEREGNEKRLCCLKKIYSSTWVCQFKWKRFFFAKVFKRREEKEEHEDLEEEEKEKEKEENKNNNDYAQDENE